MTHEITADGLYRLSISSTGKVDAANRVSDGATVWCPSGYTTDNSDTAEFMSHDYDLSDRPPTPSPSSSPAPGNANYASFRTQVSVHPAYLRIVTGTPTTQALNVNLVSLLWRYGEDPSLGIELCAIWNAIANINRPMAAEIIALNAIAVATNVPFRLQPITGLMTLV